MKTIAMANQKGGGEKILAPRPGVFGVVPVRGSLKPELMAVMEPHLDIDAHFKRHERFLVMGCVCVIGCPSDALELEPVSAEEWFHTPSSMREWEEESCSREVKRGGREHHNKTLS
jgi:hypothetical protein